MSSRPQRWIMHMDMDAFFASVEQLDDPSLRGRPVVVGGDRRGVVSTCSYEARRYGIHSAMPISEAKRRCPFAVYVRPRMRRYAEMSALVRETLADFSPRVEMASVDESYLDKNGKFRLDRAGLMEMLRFANAAAGLITTKKGAIRSMPERADIQRVTGG